MPRSGATSTADTLEFVPDLVSERAQPQTAEGAPQGGVLLARTLRERGVSTLFTLPGGHILSLLDACGDAGIRVIDTRHEGAAVLAAEGHALATGDIGVAAVTAGPGFTNGLTGFVDAATWSVPLLMIAGRTGVKHQHRGAVMDIDQLGMVAPVAKWAASCVEPGRIGAYAAEAIYAARSGCPGAAYLDIPWDVLHTQTRPLDLRQAAHPDSPPRPAAAPAEIGKALHALQTAERPLILCGSGTFWSGAGEAVASFAERASIPVITASAARGVVPDSARWCLGSLVHGGLALPAADTVLVLGSAFNANVMYGGPPLFGLDSTVIQVDVDPGRLGGNRRPDVPVCGDVRSVVADLEAAWRTTPTGRDQWLEQAKGMAAASRGFWDSQIEGWTGSGLHTGAVARELAAAGRAICGDGLTWVADGGDALAWALGYFDAEKCGRLLTTTTALGTLGVGVPFALAAQAARPEERVIALLGDGSFGLSAMEIDTAIRHRLPVVIVVSNNAGWGDVRHEQDAAFGEGRHVASELQQTRYDRLAEVLGGHGEHVERLEDLRPALQRSLDSGLCSVIDVATDPAVLSELLRMVASVGLM